jgi:hypothetical protein
MNEPTKDQPRQRPTHDQDQDQRAKAHRLVSQRIQIREELAERALNADDPSGDGPAEDSVPAREQ